MRHFRLTGAIAALACGMAEAARQAQLIALARVLQGLGSCQLCTITGAVALPAVAVTADQYCCAATGAQVMSCWRFHRQ